MSDSAERAQIISPDQWGPQLAVFDGDGICREVVGPRNGGELRSLYWFDMPAGGTTVQLVHPMEAVYYVISGQLRVESPAVSAAVVAGEGGMVHVRPATGYRLVAQAHTVLLGGPSPVDTGFGTRRPEVETDQPVPDDDRIRAFHRDSPGLMVPFISADARLVVWYGEGAVQANMNYVVLEPGERNKEHLHRYSEDTIYILQGRGTAEDVTNGEALPFGPGDVVHIPPGIVHAVAADRGERVVSVGGPCPADLDMLRAVGVDVDSLTAELETA